MMFDKAKTLWEELEALEEAYGDNFPDPSEQLDHWNRVWDKYHFYRKQLSGTQLQDLIKTENGDTY